MSELRETMIAVRMFGLPKVIYWRLFYRHHMRHLHKHGQHQLKVRPLDQKLKCDWCGHMQSTPDPRIDA